jgi:transposase InsO family protein
LDIWTALAAVFHQKVRYWPIEAQASIGRRHVKTLMQRMGIEALYRRPRTTKPEPGHKILLRGAAITRPNQVWAMDITYIPMARGFVYLAVIVWATACLGRFDDYNMLLGALMASG